MKKKIYQKPTCKAYTLTMPQLLAGSDTIGQGGESGGGHGTLPSNNLEIGFSEE